MSDELFYPGAHVAEHGDKAAYVMAGSQEVVTYRELHERATRIARLFAERGARARGPHGLLRREPSVVPGDRLGRALRRALLHRDLVPAHRRGGGLHRRRLRGTPVRHHRGEGRGGHRHHRGDSEGRGPIHARRHGRRVRLVPRCREPTEPRPSSSIPSRAWTCCIPRARRAGPRECRSRSPERPSAPPAPCTCSSPVCSAPTPTRSTCRRRPCTTPLPSDSRCRSSGPAARSWSWSTSMPRRPSV